jgi:hypothetical protein
VPVIKRWVSLRRTRSPMGGLIGYSIRVFCDALLGMVILFHAEFVHDLLLKCSLSTYIISNWKYQAADIRDVKLSSSLDQA